MKAGKDNWQATDWTLLRDPAPPTRAYTPPAASPSSTEPRWAMVAAVTLAVVAGIVVFAIINTRPPKSAALTQSVAPVIQERIIERVITATPQPTAQPAEPPAPVVIVTVPPPVVAPPARPQAQPQPVQRQTARNLPAPTQAPPAAWPAPARQTTRAVYVCQDGAQFPQEDSRWAFGPFGQWHMEGSGDVVDIRDSLENNAAMGWHYKCRREWR